MDRSQDSATPPRGEKPNQLPAPGSLPKMPDSVVNYENKSLPPEPVRVS